MIAAPSTHASAVAKYFDGLDEFYRIIWGEHLHHGYWARGDETFTEALCQMVALLAEKLALQRGEAVCDVGSGYGAVARQLAEQYQVQVVAVTNSRAQHQYATSGASITPDNPRYLCGDWLHNQLPTASFDVVLALETIEHINEKEHFLAEIYRVLKPGGRLGIAVWLAGSEARSWQKQWLLPGICRAAQLPGMPTADEYQRLLNATSFGDIQMEDITRKVKKTWPITIMTSLRQFFNQRKLRAFLLSNKRRSLDLLMSGLRIYVAYATRALAYKIIIVEKPLLSAQRLDP